MMLKRAPVCDVAHSAKKAKTNSAQPSVRRAASQALNAVEPMASTPMGLDQIVRNMDLEGQRAFVSALRSEDAVRLRACCRVLRDLVDFHMTCVRITVAEPNDAAAPGSPARRPPGRHDGDWWHATFPARLTSALALAASKWNHLTHIRLDLHATSLAPPPDDTLPAAAAAAAAHDPLGPLNGRRSVSARYAAAFAAAASADVRLPGVTSLELQVSSAELWAVTAAEAAAAASGGRRWPMPLDKDGEAAMAALRRRAAAPLVLSPALAAALATLFPSLTELSLVGPWASPDRSEAHIPDNAQLNMLLPMGQQMQQMQELHARRDRLRAAAAAAFAALAPPALPRLTRLRLPVRVATSRHLCLLTATRALAISGEDLRPLPAIAADLARVSVGGQAGAGHGHATRTQLALRPLTCLQELTLSHVKLQRLLEGPPSERPTSLQRVRLLQGSFILPPDLPAAADPAAAALLRSAASTELHVHYLLLDWPARLLSVSVLQPKTSPTVATAASAAAALGVAGTGVLRLGTAAAGSSSSASWRDHLYRRRGGRGGGFGGYGPGWEASPPLDVMQMAALVRSLAAPLGLAVLQVDAVDVTCRQHSPHSLAAAVVAIAAAPGGGGADGGGGGALPVQERAWRVLEAFASGGPAAVLALEPPPPPPQEQQQPLQEPWAAPGVAPVLVADPLPPLAAAAFAADLHLQPLPLPAVPALPVPLQQGDNAAQAQPPFPPPHHVGIHVFGPPADMMPPAAAPAPAPGVAAAPVGIPAAAIPFPFFAAPHLHFGPGPAAAAAAADAQPPPPPPPVGMEPAAAVPAAAVAVPAAAAAPFLAGPLLGLAAHPLFAPAQAPLHAAPYPIPPAAQPAPPAAAVPPLPALHANVQLAANIALHVLDPPPPPAAAAAAAAAAANDPQAAYRLRRREAARAHLRRMRQHCGRGDPAAIAAATATAAAAAAAAADPVAEETMLLAATDAAITAAAAAAGTLPAAAAATPGPMPPAVATAAAARAARTRPPPPPAPLERLLVGRATTDLSLSSAARLQRLMGGAGRGCGGAVASVEVVPGGGSGVDGFVELLQLLPNAAAALPATGATAKAVAAAAPQRLPRHLVLDSGYGFVLSHARPDPDQHQLHFPGMPPALVAAMAALRQWRHNGIDHSRHRCLPLDLVAAVLATWPAGALQSLTLLPGTEPVWRGEADADLNLYLSEQEQQQQLHRYPHHHARSDGLDGKARRLLRLLCGAAQLLDRRRRGTAAGGGASGGGAAQPRSAAAAATAATSAAAPAPAAVFPVWLLRSPALQPGAVASAVAAAHAAKLAAALAAAVPRLLQLLPRGWFLYVGHGGERELARCLEAAAASSNNVTADGSQNLCYSGAVWMSVLAECRPRGVCVEGVFAGKLECVGEGRWSNEAFGVGAAAGAAAVPPADPQAQPPQQQPQLQMLQPQMPQMQPANLAAVVAAALVAAEEAAAEAEAEAEVDLAEAAAAAAGDDLDLAGADAEIELDVDVDLELDGALEFGLPAAAPGGGLGDEGVWGGGAAAAAAALFGAEGGDDNGFIAGPVDLMDVDDY
ncbi:hypothetical protein HYH02_008662 [Chlamydomonas schloesseri]|uniref:Uncharacterized protein n=1 Tax=Chlamydomonas schloesseri TaxID=2026947 RepID=A0A836B2A9_9CHLO|nr:hypothetical protein HYH02_008662 [Chlamydomonas schloesseri]|eukprot:KAG2445194.1 hypothetical protein HYH02_008662 [Chlamydomonas schloesseri]